MRWCEVCGTMPTVDGYRCENILEQEVCFNCCNCKEHREK